MTNRSMQRVHGRGEEKKDEDENDDDDDDGNEIDQVTKGTIEAV